MNPYLFLALFIVVVVTGLLFGFYLLIDFVRAMNPIVFLLILLAIFIFFIYLVIDFASSNPNSFMINGPRRLFGCGCLFMLSSG